MDADPRILERTLLFLASATTDVTNALREMVAKCLASENSEVSGTAADFARNRNEAGLDDVVMALDALPREDKSSRASAVRSAITIGRRGRDDLVEKVPVEHLDWVAARLPAARDRLADIIEGSSWRLPDRRAAGAFCTLECCKRPQVLGPVPVSGGTRLDIRPPVADPPETVWGIDR